MGDFSVFDSVTLALDSQRGANWRLALSWVADLQGDGPSHSSFGIEGLYFDLWRFLWGSILSGV